MNKGARTRYAEATTLIGLPVVTMDGDDVAEVRDIVFGPDASAVHGFTLRKRGWLGRRMREVLPDSEVLRVGRDAVMIEDSAGLEEPADADPALKRPSKERDVIGVPVVTEAGRQLGTVADLVIRLGTEIRVVGYRLEVDVEHRREGAQSFVPLPDQTAVSGDALMVPEEFERLECSSLDEFGRAIGRDAGTGTRDDGPTRDELYEEAKAQDIPGRSDMTKEELATALERSEDST